MRSAFAQLSKSALNSRKALVALSTVIVLAVAGTTLGYAALSKSITLTVDGEEQTITAMGGTVGEILADQDIEVGEHDVVAPALDRKVTDGTAITVAFGRPLELSVDGEESTHWVTATDVDSALDEIGRRFAKADLSVSRSAPIRRSGLAVEVVTPKNVKVSVGAGRTKAHDVAAVTVRDVLDSLDVKLGKHDEVTPRLKKKVTGGEKITVTRVRIEQDRVKGEEIDFSTTERKDDSMWSGDEETVKEGRKGLRDVTYEVRYENGKVVARKVVDATVTRKPVDAVVKVGTKEAAPNFAGGNSVWDRLAQCESGGNWAINTGNGYYGGLQFSAATWRSVGGSGLPHQHSRAEQIKRGQILQARAGWGQWPACTRALGLR